ncbi:hypothetical protein, partial [Cohaesibacter gelatinilyticus]|uniref:hypothetical protein n=1 Tax=Cohaesibacter gelatinilyticus TaxID=372072 RepID=UPI001AECCEF4
ARLRPSRPRFSLFQKTNCQRTKDNKPTFSKTKTLATPPDKLLFFLTYCRAVQPDQQGAASLVKRVIDPQIQRVKHQKQQIKTFSRLKSRTQPKQ